MNVALFVALGARRFTRSFHEAGGVVDLASRLCRRTCVLCNECHGWAHTKRARVILQSIMASKHGYDFEIIDMDEDLRGYGLKRLTEAV